jgi:hypothetical protein
MQKQNISSNRNRSKDLLSSPFPEASGRVCKNPLLITSLLLVLFVLLSAGCGEVEWFPEYERLPTTPDQFSFPAKTNVPIFATVSSASITVSGLTADSSPISITGPAGNSKYSINGAAATDVAGGVTNGNTVKVHHTSSNAVGSSTSSTLTIGNVSGTFTSTTTLVAAPVFSPPAVVGSFLQVSATISSRDGVAGTHVISIRDSLGSTSAQFAIGDEDGNPGFFGNGTRTIGFLNNQRIFVRNLQANSSAVTTLTINGVDYPVTLAL